VYYPAAYLFIPEDRMDNNIEDIKRLKDFETKINQAISINSNLWHLSNDEIYKDHLNQMNNVNREKINDIKREYTKFQ